MSRYKTALRAVRIFGTALLINCAVIGVLMWAFFPQLLPFHERQPAQAQQLRPTAPYNKPLISGKPVQLVIPTAAIDIAVVDGNYNQASQKWTLTKDKAHFAVMTPLANNHQGNTFIYGHNNELVFKSLHKIKAGEYAILKTDNGKTFLYVLREVKDVAPNDVSVFAYQGNPILTVQTCSGTWYENRRLFTFDFVTVRI